MTRAQRIAFALVALVATGFGGCRSRPNVELPERGMMRDTLSATELEYGLREPAKRWPGDGTARGDSIARLATTAYWNLEGGDMELGGRMMRYVVRRGWRELFFAPDDWRVIILVSADPVAWQALGHDLLAQSPTSATGLLFRSAADSAIARKAREPRRPAPLANGGW